MNINDIDNPRQILLLKGTSALSDAENLSLVISGRDPLEKARKLLGKLDNNYCDLARLSYIDLVNEGLAPDQAFRVIACNNYAHRKQYQTASEKQVIKCSKDIADLMMPLLSDLPHEEFWTIFLNRRNRILSVSKISQGGVNGCISDIRIIMKKVVGYLACGIVICHNHPSGNIVPSEYDIVLTKKIKEASDLMDVSLLDHIIVGEKEYYSFADNGIL